jgi:hypothetical protein
MPGYTYDDHTSGQTTATVARAAGYHTRTCVLRHSYVLCIVPVHPGGRRDTRGYNRSRSIDRSCRHKSNRASRPGTVTTGRPGAQRHSHTVTRFAFPYGRRSQQWIRARARQRHAARDTRRRRRRRRRRLALASY